jgi:aspartyl-tRNA(Asn)/glutamyl-tRNA(Gln) amidotransferase subunit C
MIMSISDDEIEHLADLARLDLGEKEKDELEGDLNEILNLAEKIQDLKTEDVVPTNHVLPLDDVTREDEVREGPEPSDVLDEAPESSDGYFVVPKVIDNS